LGHNTSEHVNLKHRVILAFGAVAIREDVEGVLGVARSSYRIFDRVVDVGEHLIDDHVQLLVEEELTNM
jgi:hypothetical protein